MIQLLMGPIAGLIGKVIDKAVPDKDKAMELKFEVTRQLHTLSQTELQGAIDIIKAEAQGGSWLQRSWRPLMMVFFAAMVGSYWFGYAPDGVTPDLVEKLFELVQLGIGGYIVGRSGEKIVKTWKGQ